MSNSKFIMAKKLARVQERLMGLTVEDTSLNGLTSLIFKECIKENLTFWFNFFENEVVLNLRDIEHENYELNIRRYYDNTLKVNGNDLKKAVLINAFLIVPEQVTLEKTEKRASSEKPLIKEKKKEAKKETKKEDEPLIITGDKPIPKHINDAIDRIQAKGIPVTPEAIHNHLPLGEMSVNSRLECNKFLKEMEASQ